MSTLSTTAGDNATEKDGKPSSAELPRHEMPRDNVSFWRIVFDQTCLTPDVLCRQYPGAGTEDDPFVCEFIPNDPNNAQVWSKMRKWTVAIISAFTTFVIAFNSSAYSGALVTVITEFQCSEEVAVLGLSLFVLGYVIGPLLWGPLSELYGRRILFISTYAALTALSAGCAGANSITALLVLRLLAGIFGSSPLTNAGGVIADMFVANERGVAAAIFSAAPFVGPALGPIVGGFVADAAGWRWVMGIMAILAGFFWIVGIFTLPETYAPVLLDRRAKALQAATGSVFRTRLQVNGKRPRPRQAFKTALSRPWVLLFREPIVLVTSIYMAIIYGTLYMLFGAFPIVYQQERGWSQGVGSLPFIAILIGMLAACFYAYWDNMHRYLHVEQQARAQGKRTAPPNARLPPAIVGSIILPIGLFWFAWTNGPETPWIVSVLASLPFGFGMVLVLMCITNYLIDAYTVYAASVMAATSILRSLFGAAFPLFTDQMYQSLGIHWASSVPAFLALACLPFPLLFYKFDATLRHRCKYAHQAEMILAQLFGDGGQPKPGVEKAEKETIIQDEP